MVRNALSIASLMLAGLGQGHAAPSTGDLAFTSFNADEDGWSVVTLVDLAPSTQILFTDGTASSATAIGGTESSYSWDTGSGIIVAGTVVRFSAIDNANAAQRLSSIGTLTTVNGANLGLSATAETIYAFLGTTSGAGSTVTTMLTAVSSEATNASLTTVGLTAGVNAIKLTSSTDFAQYTGARAGETTFGAYAAMVNNPANWTIAVGGDQALQVPNTTSFTVVPVPAALPLMVSGLGLVGAAARRRRS